MKAKIDYVFLSKETEFDCLILSSMVFQILYKVNKGLSSKIGSRIGLETLHFAENLLLYGCRDDARVIVLENIVQGMLFHIK